MDTLALLTVRLAARRNLSAEEVEGAAAALAAADISDDSKEAFLSELGAKGETAKELAAFARAFRTRALDPGVGAWAARAIDIVGTGGDQSGGFNVSTLATLVLACAGVPVMKHGNRGITSKCGSADLFAAFGVDLEAPPEKQRRAMDRLGFAYFFAPAWHPAFRRIGPVRKALAARGQRTVFNILGPLLNPGRPAHVLLGAASPALAEKLADALNELGTVASLAVHGILGPGRGIDEITTATLNVVRGAGGLRSTRAEWSAGDFGLAAGPFEEMQGGDVARNLALTEALTSGGGPRGLADTIALNSAVALWIAGARPGVREGLAEARELLQGGAVRRKIADTRDFHRS